MSGQVLADEAIAGKAGRWTVTRLMVCTWVDRGLPRRFGIPQPSCGPGRLLKHWFSGEAECGRFRHPIFTVNRGRPICG